MKTGRNTAYQFCQGNSGKPRGLRNKVSLAIESLLHRQAEALSPLTALEGDGVALRLCMERIAPAPRDNMVEFSLCPL